MTIGDEDSALAVLQRFGYYRLSGYSYPLRKTKPVGEKGRLDSFVEGATLEQVIQIADFDKKLRLLTMYAIETIEVAIRVAVADHLGRVQIDAHMHPSLLDGRFTASGPNCEASAYELWVERFEDLLDKSKEDFTKHHNENYDGRMPIWVAIEVWDFGLLSRFFSGLKFRDKNAIALKFGITDGDVLKTWIRAFNFIRNVAAHHSRLWNRINTEIPGLPPLERCRWLEPLHKAPSSQRRLFGALTLMRFMLRTIHPHSDWPQQVKAHIATFPESDRISIKAAGFPEDWQSLPIWK